MFFMGWEMKHDENGCSYEQLVIGSFITTHPLMHHISLQRFLTKYQVTQWLSPTTAQIWYPAASFWLYPKLKSPLKGRDFRLSMSFRKIWWGSWRQLQKRILQGFEQWKRCWENCVRSQGAYFEGDWGVTVLCTMFLVSSSINVCIFHITGLYTFWTELIYTPKANITSILLYVRKKSKILIGS